MKLLWWIFQSIISTWMFLVFFYFVMHNWQHFCTSFHAHLWKLVLTFDVKRGMEKLASEIKTAKEEKWRMGRSRKGKRRTQEIWIAELTGWGPQENHSTAEKWVTVWCHSTHSKQWVVKFRHSLPLGFAGAQQSLCNHPAEEQFLTAKSTPSQSRRHPLLASVSSQKTLQLCLKESGPQTVRGIITNSTGVGTAHPLPSRTGRTCSWVLRVWRKRLEHQHYF